MSAEWSRACEEALVVSIVPDVCWTSMNGTMVAVPYMIIARVADATNTNPKHLIDGCPAMTMASRIPTVEGDEAGTGGGLISGVNKGWCRPVEHSTTAKSGGDWQVREGDLVAMNCAGPDGPANTYGRIVISNEDASAPGVAISKATATSVDDATGEAVIDTVEVTEDPETGAVTETRQRTVLDPRGNAIETFRIRVTTHEDGTKTYQADAGAFDPDHQRFVWNTSTGDLPSGDTDQDIMTVGADGRLYGGGDDERYFPSKALDDNDDIADDDPDVVNDPDVIAAQKEEAACQAEYDEAYAQVQKEGTKIALDILGIADPTPACDLIGAALALSDGEWLDAGMSAIAAVIPYAGDIALKPIKGLRAARRATEAERALAKLDGLLAKLRHSTKQAKGRAKAGAKKRRAAAGKPRPHAKPANPGNGGHAPGTSKPKVPEIKIKSPDACREALRKNLAPKPNNMLNPVAHHDLPVAFQEDFAKYGIDINKAQYGRWVEHRLAGRKDLHANWSGDFNKEWMKFFKETEPITRKKILEKMNELRADPRFQ